MVDTVLHDDPSRTTAVAPATPILINPRVIDLAMGDIATEFQRRAFTSQASFAIARGLAPASIVPEGLTLVREITTTAGRFVHYEVASQAAMTVYVEGSVTQVAIAGLTHDHVAQLWSASRDRAARSFESAAHVPIEVWSDSGGGPRPEEHEVPAIRWRDVRRNYPAATARAIDPLVGLTDPTGARGRLILWHGPAGTGKTTAVTSLMTEWMPWCDTHVVSDPEQFFARPDYLMEVVRHPGRMGLAERLPRMDESWPATWKLVICEDADEYLRVDARQRSGPALGRLLNLTDGLLGRGSDTLVLLTTNDDVGTLHPAVTRPGRCLASVDFPRLSEAEAATWLPPGAPVPRGGASLAELFALAVGDTLLPQVPTTGLYL